MKEQVKTPGKELSEVEISSLPKKRVQGNDHKDALSLGEKGTILPKAIYIHSVVRGLRSNFYFQGLLFQKYIT